jgi:hypothetical protein
VENQPKTKVPQSTESTKSKCIYTYRFLHSQINPSWSLDELIPLRSCLIHNNSGKVIFGDLISPVPKRLTTLEVTKENPDTGEIHHFEHYTDDFKASWKRQSKAVKEFCDFYEPLYRKKEVSVLFHTFTRWDCSKKSMSRMLDAAKDRYEALKRPVRGWLWCFELKENEKMEFGYHMHYHMVIAIDRLNVKKIPALLKFENLWGQRTGVAFVKKSVRAYLCKELNKSDAKLMNRRSYSRSRVFI